MAELRWWAEKIGKQNVIARDNDHYGIGNRQYVTNVSKARELSGTELDRITDPYTAMSLRLQAAFGLQRGESIKIPPEWADGGGTITAVMWSILPAQLARDAADSIGLMVATLIALIGWVIVRFSRCYLEGEPGQAR